MQNREAARYARWSGGVAVAIFLFVLAVYLHRRTQRDAGAKNLRPVPATVAQQSAGFTFSKVVGTQTLFTVHASQATQFKDENRSLLENVTITIYGARGDRNDSVRADECSYEPAAGNIRCQGVVEVDLRNAKSRAQDSVVHFETKDILFDGRSGEASTANAVAFEFPGGEGKGTGILYDPQSENVTLQRDVQLEIVPPRKARAIPVRVSGSALEFRRSENLLRLTGPLRAQQNSRTLTAGNLQLQLDDAMQPARVLATDRPKISDSGGRRKVSVSANHFSAKFSPDGMLEQVAADENANGDSVGREGKNHFSAQHAEISMVRTRTGTKPRDALAQGSVKIEMSRGEVQRNISTEGVRLELSPRTRGTSQGITSAETLAPGEIVTTGPRESDRLQGGRLNAAFGARSELTELRGSSGVYVERTLSGKPPQSSTAQSLLAMFGSDGQWQVMDENGDVKFSDGSRSGGAAAARIVRATNEMKLTGSASVSTATSHLQANEIQINQSTNEIRASGNVAGSFAKQKGTTMTNAASPLAKSSQGDNTQISADEMTGTLGKTSSGSSLDDGHAIFTAHARLWQGADILQAQTIEFWQQEKRTEARGNVLGAFVEAPHKSQAGRKQPEKKTAPVLWQVQSPKVGYRSDDGKMEWSGGVIARSSEGTIASQSLEMFFSRAENSAQELERAIADGNVHIEQNGRTGTAERGEYFALDGRFILSGGTPTLADSSGNTTTGHELTFFLANDSVLVDSRGKLPTSTAPH